MECTTFAKNKGSVSDVGFGEISTLGLMSIGANEHWGKGALGENGHQKKIDTRASGHLGQMSTRSNLGQMGSLGSMCIEGKRAPGQMTPGQMSIWNKWALGQMSIGGRLALWGKWALGELEPGKLSVHLHQVFIYPEGSFAPLSISSIIPISS